MDIKNIFQELENLPKGYISKKVIKGHTYFYLQYFENGKLLSKYIPKEKANEIAAQIKRRKELEKAIKLIGPYRPLRKLSNRDKSLSGAIMMGDRVTARFVDGNISYIDESTCPLYIKRTKDVSTFLANRILDLSRPNARLLLKTLAIQDKKEEYIALYSRGLCISDNYWFRASGSKLKYSDICFDNDAYSDLALKGKIVQMPAFGRSPELTAIGSFEKCWKKIAGEWWMYKAGKNEEIFSELFCFHLAKLLKIPTAIYEFSDGFIRTKNFADKHNFEPMFSLADDNEEYEFVFNLLYRLDQNIAQSYIALLWFDCLVFNPDRHNQNYGLLRNKKNGNIISLAPNFDNNLALIAYSKTLHQDPQTDNLIKLFTTFLNNNKQAMGLFKNMPMHHLNVNMVNSIFKEIPIKFIESEIGISSFIMNRYLYLKSIYDS